MTLLGTQLQVPEVKIVTHTLSTPAIPVDLILDVGNTHTCGVIIEDHGDANDGLRQTAELQVRSLSEPQFIMSRCLPAVLSSQKPASVSSIFPSKAGVKMPLSGPLSCAWAMKPANWRCNARAPKATAGSPARAAICGMKPPVLQDWRFSQMNSKTQREPLATAFPLMNLMNDEGQPLYSLPLDERLPVFSPQYSRSTLMTHMLCELLAQALGQINSVATRLRLGFPASPRQLRTIILTLPSAMPKQEREIFRRRMFEAIALVWKAMGWHPQDEDFANRKQQEKKCCSGAAYSDGVGRSQLRATGVAVQRSHLPFCRANRNILCRYRPPGSHRRAGCNTGRSLRVASVDIGGGTTDMAITHYQLDDGTGSNVKITPKLLFREGFKVAGDDILLDVIQRCVLPALQTQMQKPGSPMPPRLWRPCLAIPDALIPGAVLRQQTTLQLFMPVGHAILAALGKRATLMIRWPGCTLPLASCSANSQRAT